MCFSIQQLMMMIMELHHTFFKLVPDHIQVASDVLMSVEVKVMSNDDCEASRGMAYGYEQSLEGQITSNMVCAKDDGEDSCQGDSGGPAVVHNIDPSKDVQIGVVSWGIGCAHSSFPGV